MMRSVLPDLFVHLAGDVGRNLTILYVLSVKSFFARRVRADATNMLNVRAP